MPNYQPTIASVQQDIIAPVQLLRRNDRTTRTITRARLSNLSKCNKRSSTSPWLRDYATRSWQYRSTPTQICCKTCVYYVGENLFAASRKLYLLPKEKARSEEGVTIVRCGAGVQVCLRAWLPSRLAMEVVYLLLEGFVSRPFWGGRFLRLIAHHARNPTQTRNHATRTHNASHTPCSQVWV